jgi:hypothetical protein
MAHLGRVINPGIAVVLQPILDGIFLSMDYDIRFPGESFLLTIVKGTRKLVLRGTGHVTHIIWAKEMVKQEHVSIPSIPGT